MHKKIQQKRTQLRKGEGVRARGEREPKTGSAVANVDDDDENLEKIQKNARKNALPGEGSYPARYSRPLLVYTRYLPA